MGGKHSKGYKWLKHCNAVDGFSPEEVKKIFSTYDTTGDGVLDNSEAKAFFSDYCKAKKVKPTPSEIQKLFKLFDSTGDGSVSWSELNKLEMPGCNRLSSLEKKRVQQKTNCKESAPPVEQPEIKKTVIGDIFTKYASMEDEPDAMFGDGLAGFLDDLNLSGAVGYSCLVLLYNIQAANCGEITRTEFLSAFESKNRCSSFADIERVCNSWKTAVSRNDKNFKKFYSWCFDFLLDKEESKQTLSPEEALENWEPLLNFGPAGKWGLWCHWKVFIEWKADSNEQEQPLHHITKDQWEMLYEVARDLKPDLSNLEQVDGGFWPKLLDEFVQCQANGELEGYIPEEMLAAHNAM